MTYPVLSAGSAAPYFLQRSVRLRSSATAYFNRTPSVTGNTSRFTLSIWLKQGSKVNTAAETYILSGQTPTGGRQTAFQFTTTQGLYFGIDSANGGAASTTAIFRDASAWYHIVLSYDSAQALGSRCKIYVNGSANIVTSDTTTGTSYWNTSGYLMVIGRNLTGGFSRDIDGYLAEVNFIDGQALTPSSFGQYNPITGVWQPKKYVGTYGTNGFYLNFEDNSGATATTIGKDSSGNGNNWTPNNISVTAGVTYDSMLDVPTFTSTTQANYPTLNVIGPGNAGGTYSNANLNFVSAVANQWRSGISTMFLPSGKFYFEATIQVLGANNFLMIGACGIQTNATIYGNYTGLAANGWSVQCNGTTGGTKYNNGGATNVTNATFANWLVNDVLQCAVDVTNGRIWFGKNNTWLEGVPSAGTGASFTNLTGSIAPSVSCFSNTGAQLAVNFGQRPFTYTAPTGFGSPLNAYNLPAPSISNGANQFAATLYTGNGATQSITNTVLSASFQPDLVWIKGRSGATNNGLQDSVRGTAGGILISNSTAAESAGGAYISSLNSNGFTVNANTSGNGNAATYVGWQWKASNAAAVSNTSGSITSQVSANPTAGFSIITYTSQASGVGTIGHGLGVAPALIINKPRTGSVAWTVYHRSIGNNAYLILNTTAAQVTGATTVWNSTSPSSTVFTQGSAFAGLGTMVAYCFSEIAGYSAFGTYTGNGVADGPFIYLGFRPRWIMFKSTSTGGVGYGWSIYDTSRDPYNQNINPLNANSSDAESTTASFAIDLVSNGVKLRGLNQNINQSTITYIYAAFAENPFQYSLAR